MQNILVRAIEQQQLVQIIYLDANQKITQRIVRPYEINEKHLKGFCFLRKQVRLFKLDDILAVSPLRQTNKRLG
ncbi:WYL domain-containing protein [Mesobacillus maritimus]|uniref:WYL domain-containing protein n=1 Tax=Mesobacillus maritimus TaxID=1643336 RepID=UPI00384DDF16